MFDQLSERRTRLPAVLFALAVHAGLFFSVREVALQPGFPALVQPPCPLCDLRIVYRKPRPGPQPTQNTGAPAPAARRGDRYGRPALLPALSALGAPPETQTALPEPPPEALIDEPEQPQRPKLKWLVDTLYVPSSVRVEPPVRSASCKSPPMPEQARIFGIEGEVRARYVVNADGSVGQFTVLNQAPDVLANAVEEWLGRCHHQPAQVSGEAIPVQVETPFVFRLK